MTLKNGESVTFEMTGYAAMFTGLPFTDLYYASGTSSIYGNAVITVAKSDDGALSFEIQAYKTWMDTYDWHAGAVARGVGATDSGMLLLENFGAKEFEMRAYYETTLYMCVQSMRIERGAKHEWNDWCIKSNNECDKSIKHFDLQTTIDP